MQLSDLLIAVVAALFGAGLAFAGTVYSAKVSRDVAAQGWAAQRAEARERWDREHQAANLHWLRDQIDGRVGHVLVAVNRFTRAHGPGEYDGAWLEYANADDRLARLAAGESVDDARRRLNEVMHRIYQWRTAHPELSDGRLMSEWWRQFDEVWPLMGRLNSASGRAVRDTLSALS